MIKTITQLAGEDLLSRYFVGYFSNKNDVLTRSNVRRWAYQTWRGAQGLLVYDMNGINFLFKSQSSKEVEHVLMGDWRRQGNHLNLQW